MSKTIITCALTGVLTDPKKFKVPVTPKEMAHAALEAYNAGASIVHCHFRSQEPGQGQNPTWDVKVVTEICSEIKSLVPKIILNFSTGVMGNDISGPVQCLEKLRPEIAALNSGSLNYLKVTQEGKWAWPPLLFDNPVEKIEKFIKVMDENEILPECECFDTGIVRSIKMFKARNFFNKPINISFVMGVESGMPSNPLLLDILLPEIPKDAQWQVIAIGRTEVWKLHKRAAELGGNLRTGLEDTFYLPDGSRTESNGKLIEALVKIAQSAGRSISSASEARTILNLKKQD